MKEGDEMSHRARLRKIEKDLNALRESISPDRIYPVPKGLFSFEQRIIEDHEDIGSMTRSEILLEIERIHSRLRIDQKPPRWLFQRLDRFRKALDG